MGAAGALELAGNLPAFDDGVCHATINVDRLDPECRLAGLVVNQPREVETRRHHPEQLVRNAGDQFGGDCQASVTETSGETWHDGRRISEKRSSTSWPTSRRTKISADLKDDVPFREQLELDSMDFLDIVMELRKRYRIQIPEDDYSELASMDSTVEYLEPLMKDMPTGMSRRARCA